MTFDDVKAIFGCSLFVLFMFISTIVIAGVSGVMFVVQVLFGLGLAFGAYATIRSFVK